MSFLQRHREAREGAATPPAAPAEDAAPAADGQAAYAACTTDTRRSHHRLRLHYADGTIGLMSYAYLVEVLCTSHQYVSLLYSNVAITLEGRHLDQLLDALQEEKVRALVCYHARRHAAPEAGTPVITKIVRQSLPEVARRIEQQDAAKDGGMGAG